MVTRFNVYHTKKKKNEILSRIRTLLYTLSHLYINADDREGKEKIHQHINTCFIFHPPPIHEKNYNENEREKWIHIKLYLLKQQRSEHQCSLN